MRILFFMPSASRIGGVETWLDRAYDHFGRSGHEPIVGLLRGQRSNRPDQYRSLHPNLSQTVEVDGRGLNREGRVRALARSIKSVRPHVVIPLGTVDANEAVIRRKRSGQTVRVLHRAQGNLPPMLADMATYRDWIDLVVCPGVLTERVILQWAGFERERVTRVPNGADVPIRTLRERGSDAPLRVGYIGRMTQGDKRAQDLIALNYELRKRNVDYHLDVVGDGPFYPELRAALGSQSNVTLHGALSHSEVYKNIFPNLDALVLTSASESFGIVIVEAMMHGVVPVTSRYDGFHAEGLVREGFSGLSFAIGAMGEAAEAFVRLHHDRELLEQLSTRSVELAKDYTWDRCFERWDEVVGRVLSRPPVMGSTAPHGVPDQGFGSLDRLGFPPAVSDIVRRARRALMGPAVPPGGEEWPLYYRHHSPETLESVREALAALDVADDSVLSEPLSLAR